jgi:GDP-4-dehydro-6-deoxy-D-mannose reductase
MRVLVTGSNGFVGNHLIKELVRRGHEVLAGVTRKQFNVTEGFLSEYLDVLDTETINNIFQKFKPEGIIHLAAQTMVKRSWEEPEKTLATNIFGTINLIKAIEKFSPNAKMISIGSSEEYGLTGKSGVPLTEDMPCLPQNPYATSKLAAGQLALQYGKKSDLKIIHVRAFNHFGPGQNIGFVVSDFISQIVDIEIDKSPPVIRVGDLSAQRDFVHVTDLIRAYILALELDVDNGIYNVCSGIPRKIGDILDFLIKKAKKPITVELDCSRLRPSEVPLFVGSSEKIKKAIGWEPKINFYEALMETLEWWRQKS